MKDAEKLLLKVSTFPLIAGIGYSLALYLATRMEPNLISDIVYSMTQSILFLIAVRTTGAIFPDLKLRAGSEYKGKLKTEIEVFQATKFVGVVLFMYVVLSAILFAVVVLNLVEPMTEKFLFNLSIGLGAASFAGIIISMKLNGGKTFWRCIIASLKR